MNGRYPPTPQEQGVTAAHTKKDYIMTQQTPNYKRSASGFFVAAFGVVILAISAVTTFSFFATYFTQIFPTGMLGMELAGLLAGGAGVVLFDLAAVYWLNTFLNHAETAEQRGIALLMLVVTFIGAAGASVAQLGLAASGDVALDASTRQTIANAAVWTVIAGVVANFGANIAYGRYSLMSKAAVMEADRRDMLQSAEDEQARLLDGLIAQNVKELIADEAAALAQEQASRLVSSFRRREMAKYAGQTGQDGHGGHHPPYNVEYRIPGSRADDWQRLPDGYTLNDAIREYNRIGPNARIVTTRGRDITDEVMGNREPAANGANPTQRPAGQ